MKDLKLQMLKKKELKKRLKLKLKESWLKFRQILIVS